MEIIKKEEKKEILMKNNELIKTRYSLSLIENKLFMWMLYKLQRTSNGEMMCEIPRSEFKIITKKTNNLTIKGVSKILDNLLSKKISFKIINENGKGYEWNKHNLINGFAYNDDTDTFKLYCSERIYTLLTSYYEIDEKDNRIFKGYTPINLKVYLSLENTVSQRMYELLRLWSKSKHVITYEVDDIKELLMIEDKYDRYNDFKKKVIIASIDELNKSKAFKITYEENKIGRKVTSISFKVDDLDDRTYWKKDIESDDKDTSEKPQIPPESFFIPNEDIFTPGTLLWFKKDFKDYDFKDEVLQDAFYDAVAALFERDEVNKIVRSGYPYFKKTLTDRIGEHMKKKVKEDFNNSLWGDTV